MTERTNSIGRTFIIGSVGIATIASLTLLIAFVMTPNGASISLIGIASMILLPVLLAQLMYRALRKGITTQSLSNALEKMSKEDRSWVEAQFNFSQNG